MGSRVFVCRVLISRDFERRAVIEKVFKLFSN